MLNIVIGYFETGIVITMVSIIIRAIAKEDDLIDTLNEANKVSGYLGPAAFLFGCLTVEVLLWPAFTCMYLESLLGEWF